MLNPLSYPSHTITVSYEKTVEQLVLDGKYKTHFGDVKFSDSNFRSLELGIRQIDVYLIKLGYKIIKSEIIKELDRVGLRPLSLKELLTLGANQVSVQKGAPILGMDSKWRDKYDHVRIPEIYFDDKFWWVTLDYFENDSLGHEIFAATYK